MITYPCKRMYILSDKPILFFHPYLSLINTTEPFHVRLTNGTTDSEGRVKVLYKGSWGTICDDNWDLRDASVVCKMLGFAGALAAPGSARFGAGSGKILLDDVGCKGTEDTLARCYHLGL